MDSQAPQDATNHWRSRSEYDGVDGFRRPKNVPSAGYFKEYKHKDQDWPWWAGQVEGIYRLRLVSLSHANALKYLVG